MSYFESLNKEINEYLISTFDKNDIDFVDLDFSKMDYFKEKFDSIRKKFSYGIEFQDYLDRLYYNFSLEYNVHFYINNENKTFYVKNELLYIFLYIIKNFGNFSTFGEYRFNIYIPLLEKLLTSKNINFDCFYTQVSNLNIIEKKLNNSLTLFFKENSNIYPYNRQFLVNDLLFINKNLEYETNLINLQESLNKDVEKLNKTISILNKSVEKSKVDYIAILGIFVAIFTLISFTGTIGNEIIKKEQIQINYLIKSFLLLGSTLTIFLTFLILLIKIFIYDDIKSNNVCFLILIFIFSVITLLIAFI